MTHIPPISSSSASAGAGSSSPVLPEGISLKRIALPAIESAAPPSSPSASLVVIDPDALMWARIIVSIWSEDSRPAIPALLDTILRVTEQKLRADACVLAGALSNFPALGHLENKFFEIAFAKFKEHLGSVAKLDEKVLLLNEGLAAHLAHTLTVESLGVLLSFVGSSQGRSILVKAFVALNLFISKTAIAPTDSALPQDADSLKHIEEFMSLLIVPEDEETIKERISLIIRSTFDKEEIKALHELDTRMQRRSDPKKPSALRVSFKELPWECKGALRDFLVAGAAACLQDIHPYLQTPEAFNYLEAARSFFHVVQNELLVEKRELGEKEPLIRKLTQELGKPWPQLAADAYEKELKRMRQELWQIQVPLFQQYCSSFPAEDMVTIVAYFGEAVSGEMQSIKDQTVWNILKTLEQQTQNWLLTFSPEDLEAYYAFVTSEVGKSIAAKLIGFHSGASSASSSSTRKDLITATIGFAFKGTTPAKQKQIAERMNAFTQEELEAFHAFVTREHIKDIGYQNPIEAMPLEVKKRFSARVVTAGVLAAFSKTKTVDLQTLEKLVKFTMQPFELNIFAGGIVVDKTDGVFRSRAHRGP